MGGARLLYRKWWETPLPPASGVARKPGLAHGLPASSQALVRQALMNLVGAGDVSRASGVGPVRSKAPLHPHRMCTSRCFQVEDAACGFMSLPCLAWCLRRPQWVVASGLGSGAILPLLQRSWLHLVGGFMMGLGHHSLLSASAALCSSPSLPVRQRARRGHRGLAQPRVSACCSLCPVILPGRVRLLIAVTASHHWRVPL